MNISIFTIGDTISYICPWTGFTEYGKIIEPRGATKDVWGQGFYDIQNDDGTIDVTIHASEISHYEEKK